MLRHVAVTVDACSRIWGHTIGNDSGPYRFLFRKSILTRSSRNPTRIWVHIRSCSGPPQYVGFGSPAPTRSSRNPKRRLLSGPGAWQLRGRLQSLQLTLDGVEEVAEGIQALLVSSHEARGGPWVGFRAEDGPQQYIKSRPLRLFLEVLGRLGRHGSFVYLEFLARLGSRRVQGVWG